MENINILCILISVLVLVLSVVASFVIVSLKISANNAKGVDKYINLNKTINDIKDNTNQKINSIFKEINSLKNDIDALSHRENSVSDERFSTMEKKLFEISDKLNVLDSTVKNIERMKDVEINESSSPYYYKDETVSDKANSLKDKVRSGYEKAVDIGSKIDFETAIKTAPKVVKAVKTMLKK